MKTKIRGTWDDIIVSTGEALSVDGEVSVIGITLDKELGERFSISLDVAQTIELIKTLEEAIS